MSLFFRKPFAMLHGVGRGADLKRTLSWQHLIAVGVGAVIGTGIYTPTGIGAGRAGPAVILAFALCGVVHLHYNQVHPDVEFDFVEAARSRLVEGLNSRSIAIAVLLGFTLPATANRRHSSGLLLLRRVHQ